MILPCPNHFHALPGPERPTLPQAGGGVALGTDRLIFDMGDLDAVDRKDGFETKS